MKVYILDEDAAKCASYYCDSDIEKSMTDIAKILVNTASIINSTEFDEKFKVKTVINPIMNWTRKTLGNYLWLRRLYFELNDKLVQIDRRSKNHKDYNVIYGLIPPNLNLNETTSFPKDIIGSYIKTDHAVTNYRLFYIDKRKRNKYINGKPKWM